MAIADTSVMIVPILGDRTVRIIISDEERHEVAKNLRKEFNNDFYGVYPRIVRLPKFSGFLKLNHNAAMNLANLIDRQTCHIIQIEPGWWECDECGCSPVC